MLFSVAQAQSDEELSDLERAKYPITLLALNGNRPLAEEISEIIGVPLSEARISKFSDGEVS
jgi:phosphoribosylpyrophosphate synthetase